MSWATSDGKHEGWIGSEVPGGRIATGSTAGYQILFNRVTGEETRIPNAEVTAWVLMCECGWRGTRWERVADPEAENRQAHRPYDADGYEPGWVEDEGHREWQAHIAPFEALDVVRDATSAVRDAQRRLDTAVNAARAAGASWLDIGNAADMSRQAAHQRWSTTP